MYLENIFVGSEDIRKQLPSESVMFEKVNAAFVEKTRALAEAKKVLVAVRIPRILETF